jgi:AcrR family transcriptional regulator
MMSDARVDRHGEAGEGGARSTKEDWLDLAARTLMAEGIDNVKVQVMARQLGVSRSSFYWFFDSIADLQDQLLRRWLAKNTGPIIERAMRPAGSINTAICNVFECWIDDELFDPDLDTAVRIWGRHDGAVRPVLDEADRQRADALTRMFQRYGYPAEEAETRARVLYYTQIGHFTLQVAESLLERLAHLDSYLLTFSGRAPQPAETAAFEALVHAKSEAR